MATEYCDPEDVSGFMTMLFGENRLIFDSKSNPTRQEVESLINTIEDVIDEDLDTTFKVIPRSRVAEPHKFIGLDRDRFGKRSYDFKADFGPVVPLETPADKFEVWNGNEWIDWLADGAMGIGPYKGKFYIAINTSRFFIYSYGIQEGPSPILVTYRYGYGAVPGQIKRLTILLTAIDLMTTQLQFLSLPDGDNNLSRAEIIELWKTEIKDIKDEYQPFMVAN